MDTISCCESPPITNTNILGVSRTSCLSNSELIETAPFFFEVSFSAFLMIAFSTTKGYCFESNFPSWIYFISWHISGSLLSISYSTRPPLRTYSLNCSFVMSSFLLLNFFYSELMSASRYSIFDSTFLSPSFSTDFLSVSLSLLFKS